MDSNLPERRRPRHDRVGSNRGRGVPGGRGVKAPVGRRGAHDRTERRRWESNPLQPGCSRSPGRLAPASLLTLALDFAAAACPRQELNLALDLRRVVCDPTHPEDVIPMAPSLPFRHPPPGNRTRPRGFEGRDAPDTPTGNRSWNQPSPAMPLPGVEPGLRPSEGRVRIRHTPGATEHVLSLTIR